ncbi:MAG: hypothetical protein DRI32_03775 [Chloroflexi bacterium]|nr:MAG: hypothetical protein DRI32_03775 [Chloroflexota bacterium]
MYIPPALIITYNPQTDFYTRLDAFYNELSQVIIVDNGSSLEARHLLEEEAQRRENSLHIIFNEENRGVATALNQGFRLAVEEGFEQIFTFDQDSSPTEGMLTALWETFKKTPKHDHLAVVSPVVGDSNVNIHARFLRAKKGLFFERVACMEEILPNISFSITSGSLFNLKAYQQLGVFQDDFFIDYVDIEYCLRANQADYQIIAVCDAYLEHRLGEREKRELLGRKHYPTFHSPLRWYYISRNRIPMLKKYALRFPHWFSFEIISSTYILIRMLLFETQKTIKLRAVFLGTFDGLRGRMGKATRDIERKLKC